MEVNCSQPPWQPLWQHPQQLFGAKRTRTLFKCMGREPELAWRVNNVLHVQNQQSNLIKMLEKILPRDKA